MEHYQDCRTLLVFVHARTWTQEKFKQCNETRVPRTAEVRGLSAGLGGENSQRSELALGNPAAKVSLDA